MGFGDEIEPAVDAVVRRMRIATSLRRFTWSRWISIGGSVASILAFVGIGFAAGSFPFVGQDAGQTPEELASQTEELRSLIVFTAIILLIATVLFFGSRRGARVGRLAPQLHQSFHALRDASDKLVGDLEEGLDEASAPQVELVQRRVDPDPQATTQLRTDLRCALQEFCKLLSMASGVPVHAAIIDAYQAFEDDASPKMTTIATSSNALEPFVDMGIGDTICERAFSLYSPVEIVNNIPKMEKASVKFKHMFPRKAGSAGAFAIRGVHEGDFVLYGFLYLQSVHRDAFDRFLDRELGSAFADSLSTVLRIATLVYPAAEPETDGEPAAAPAQRAQQPNDTGRVGRDPQGETSVSQSPDLDSTGSGTS